MQTFVTLEGVIVWLLATLAVSFCGSWLGAYFKKKGENFATHEDIGKLVEQMSAVTRATKNIEAKISSDLWDRQKRWELRREVLFEATKRLADVEDGLLSLDSVLQVEQREQKKDDEPGWVEARHEKITKWSKASAAFDEARLLVCMVCEKETIVAFEEFGLFVNAVAARIAPGRDLEIYKKSQVELFRRRMAVQAEMRKELGIEGVGVASE
jgi:hypothetical protein